MVTAMMMPFDGMLSVLMDRAERGSDVAAFLYCLLSDRKRMKGTSLEKLRQDAVRSSYMCAELELRRELKHLQELGFCKVWNRSKFRDRARVTFNCSLSTSA